MNKEYLIIGGGHQGLAMAAHLALNNEKVKLWNRSYKNIEKIIEIGHIECEGVIKGKALIDKISSDIDEVWCEILMITTPATAYEDIAKLIAAKVSDKTVIILNPGRTFGARDFKRLLEKNGCTAIPRIAETQTIVYTCRRDNVNGVTVFAFKNDVKIASLKKEDNHSIKESLPDCLKNKFSFAESDIITSLGNVGMILHCAPMLMNIGWIESKVAQFEYYYDGISETIAKFLEKLDVERLSIARKLGYDLESTKDWMIRSYDIHGSGLYECINNNTYYKGIYAPKTIKHRYIEEDIPYGLVPLENAGKALSIDTPLTSLVINIANAAMETDYRLIGRSFLRLV